MFSCYLPILLLTLHAAHALPHPRRFTLDYGSESLSQRSFETSELVRRGPTASPCSRLDLDDAESLPGWPKLLQYARSTWGEGDWTIEINPSGYKDKPATMCVADPVKVVATGPSNCTEQRKDIQPTTKGGNQVRINEGYTNTGIWNITNVTTAAHAEFFTGKFQMPNMTKLHFESITTDGKFINAPYNSFSTVATNVTYKNNQLTQVDDKTCIGTILEQQCLTPAQGRIQLFATGYIWFNYKTRRAPLANPKGGKHRRCSSDLQLAGVRQLLTAWVSSLDTVKIEDVLKNVTERSTFIDFTGYMNTTWRYDYFDECRWNFKLN
ncbi:hypothetical protein CVT26_010314 [Gymnopilus dilepis]|uniref:Uncharacterized protein n=1 Tax=Gymnopilus dilepis TaxID=231916 RepID=A0A409Y107_9AGAR|nr:hypothetical protein CVT26_010314 [Gymnopilus dilepis]